MDMLREYVNVFEPLCANMAYKHEKCDTKPTDENKKL